MSTTLERLLATVPATYDALEAALDSTGSLPTDREQVAGNPNVTRPAPTSLDVVDLRHQLLRGLRWWVARTREVCQVDGPPAMVGDSPARACAWLAAYTPELPAPVRAELAANLQAWEHRATPWLGNAEPAPEAPRLLPPEAADQWVRVADAAKVLGCTVRTIRRRAPDRRDGMVRLADAVAEADRCTATDLPATMCAHCAVSQ